METIFNLKTSSFDPKKRLPNKYVFNNSGCAGDNISPALEWSGAPPETRSFAVTVFDPDAPTGHGWWHWTVVNIPANITRLQEGASNDHQLPSGVIEGKTDYGLVGYGGACPPYGDKPHRYVFTVYALKSEKININPKTSGALVKESLEIESLAKASFTVEYGR